MARYMLIDDDAHEIMDRDVDVSAFVAANDLDAYEVDKIETLPRGHVRRYGGGAAPQFSLMRVE